MDLFFNTGMVCDRRIPASSRKDFNMKKVKNIFGYLAIINFVSFLASTIYLGGDALSGKIENGHFFLSSHGRLTEVNEDVFEYSKCHGLSVFAFIGLFLIIHCFGKAEEVGEH